MGVGEIMAVMAALPPLADCSHLTVEPTDPGQGTAHAQVWGLDRAWAGGGRGRGAGSGKKWG